MAIIVVGESLAGVAAALELAEAGFTVHINLHHGDNTGLEDSYLIGPTALNASPMRGTAFADLAVDLLEGKRVRTRRTDSWFGMWDEVSIDSSTGELILNSSFDNEHRRFKAAIFAPSGSEIGLPRMQEETFFSKGLSYSAWSDVLYFRGKQVAVIGCGFHAYEQALIAAEHASSVTMLCESSDTG